MSEYDCIGVTSEYLKSLKNKIAELQQQNRELTEISLMLKDRCLSILNKKPIRDLDEIICRLEKYHATEEEGK